MGYELELEEWDCALWSNFLEH